MLVLTRKLMEKLYIGEDICVTVVRLEGGQVRLGIDAPREVSVVRAELVPDRERAVPRPRSLGPSRLEDEKGNVRCSPASVHGNDIRRRGRFR
jgi:carbon storage regulator